MSQDRTDTKVKLLDAAETLFAERGFDEVSIRDLAATAGVNVAAVNYHFQGKENLFHEVITRRFVAQRDKTIGALDQLLTGAEGPPPLDRVIGIVAGEYLAGAIASAGHSTFLTLVMREMHVQNPRSHAAFFKEMVAPILQVFSRGILQARPHLAHDQVDWIIASVLGQIHHFIMRWFKKASLPDDDETLKFMLAAFPVLGEPREEYIRKVSDHIACFTAAAVDGMYPEVSA